MSKLVAIIALIFIAAFALWIYTDKQDAKGCKAKYGNQYTVEHSRANSSIKWCQSPDGLMRAL